MRADAGDLELTLLDDDGIRARVVWARAVAGARREPADVGAPLGVADVGTPLDAVGRGAQLADGERQQPEQRELDLDGRRRLIARDGEQQQAVAREAHAALVEEQLDGRVRPARERRDVRHAEERAEARHIDAQAIEQSRLEEVVAGHERDDERPR